MKELRDAIRAVLESADVVSTSPLVITINAKALYILQEEFNIHFVEPEDTQITTIERPV